VMPLEALPGPLAAVGAVLPAAPLAELFRIALGSAGDLGPALGLLAAWAAGAVALAVAQFRFE
ncbi:MAG TPA: hypothetical protein VM344_00935, partial [Vitreimonas sp.]|nr:hypothetical protein [Vitreimonas sp.]